MNESQILELHQEIKDSFFNELQVLKSSASDFEIDDKIKKDIKKLRSFGFVNFDLSRALRAVDENKAIIESVKELEELKNNFKDYRIISNETIKSICEKHKLVCDYLDKYTAEVPFETISYIEKYFKDFRTGKYSNTSISKFKIIAPKSKFDQDAEHLKKEDPILIAKIHNTDYFAVVHSWGYEKEILKNLK